MFMAVEAGVWAAWITGAAVVFSAMVAGPIMWLLTRLDKRNSAQHAVAELHRAQHGETLARIESKVDGMDQKHDRLSDGFSRHMEYHAHVDKPGGRRVTDPSPEWRAEQLAE